MEEEENIDGNTTFADHIKNSKHYKTEHLSFYCTPTLKSRIIRCSEMLNEPVSRAIRILLHFAFRRIEEESDWKI